LFCFLSRLHAQHGAQPRAWIHDPEIKSWAEIKSWFLNQLSHPGAPSFAKFLYAPSILLGSCCVHPSLPLSLMLEVFFKSVLILGGTCLAQLVEHETLGIGVVSSSPSPMLGLELALKKKKCSSFYFSVQAGLLCRLGFTVGWLGKALAPGILGADVCSFLPNLCCFSSVTLLSSAVSGIPGSVLGFLQTVSTFVSCGFRER